MLEDHRRAALISDHARRAGQKLESNYPPPFGPLRISHKTGAKFSPKGWGPGWDSPHNESVKTKRKVPPTYSRADENARSLDGRRDDEGCYVAQAACAVCLVRSLCRLATVRVTITSGPALTFSAEYARDGRQTQGETADKPKD